MGGLRRVLKNCWLLLGLIFDFKYRYLQHLGQLTHSVEKEMPLAYYDQAEHYWQQTLQADFLLIKTRADEPEYTYE